MSQAATLPRDLMRPAALIVGGVVLVALALWLIDPDPRIAQAIVAGTFVAIGWLVNGWQNRREQAALRDEKLRDYHRALFAEIGNAVENLGTAEGLNSFCEVMVGKMADPGFLPLIPTEQGDTIFRAVSEELHILPRVTIDAVVAYYSQLHALTAMAEDMRGARFAQLDVDRRIAMYRHYIAMKKQQLEFGEHALLMIDVFAKQGEEEALRLRAQARGPMTALSDPSRRITASQDALNTPAAGRSGQ